MWSGLWQIFVIIWSKRLLDPVQYIKQHSIMAGIWTTHTQDNSYPRQLVPRTTRTQDKSYPGQLVPKTTRTHDNSYTRQLVPRSTRTHVVWYHIYHIIYHISYHISYIIYRIISYYYGSVYLPLLYEILSRSRENNRAIRDDYRVIRDD